MNAASGRAWMIWVNASTHIHPMTIYSVEDIHFGHVTQQILNTIPIRPAIATMLNNVLPMEFLKVIKQRGA